jgi:hypothetical protein
MRLSECFHLKDFEFVATELVTYMCPCALIPGLSPPPCATCRHRPPQREELGPIQLRRTSRAAPGVTPTDKRRACKASLTGALKTTPTCLFLEASRRSSFACNGCIGLHTCACIVTRLLSAHVFNCRSFITFIAIMRMFLLSAGLPFEVWCASWLKI